MQNQEARQIAEQVMDDNGMNDQTKNNHMCRPQKTPMNYRHTELMQELNELNICLKLWLHPEEFGAAANDMKKRYAKPDLKYIDSVQRRVIQALERDAEPFIKY